MPSELTTSYLNIKTTRLTPTQSYTLPIRVHILLTPIAYVNSESAGIDQFSNLTVTVSSPLGEFEQFLDFGPKLLPYLTIASTIGVGIAWLIREILNRRQKEATSI
jgi:hypothetical protein